MKNLLKKLSFAVFILTAICIQNINAQSTVYFFIDFRFWNPEYNFKVNGEDGFTLNPEGKVLTKGSDTMMYNMCARKIIFENSDSYVISVDCPSPQGTYHADLNLNLENGETYYVICNAKVGKTFYMENLTEKEGLKLLKKAQKSNKYTINEDFIYTGK